MATKSQSALSSPDCRSHFIQTSRLTSTWTTRAIRRFRCPSDKNLQISKKINLGLRFFWKVIVDGKSKRGIAMLGSNNPHAAQTPPCTAIAQEVSWLRWWGFPLGIPLFISGNSGFISTPPSPALWTQWRWRRGLWPPALLKISQQLFKSSRGALTPQEDFSYEMERTPLASQNKCMCWEFYQDNSSWADNELLEILPESWQSWLLISK